MRSEEGISAHLTVQALMQSMILKTAVQKRLPMAVLRCDAMKIKAAKGEMIWASKLQVHDALKKSALSGSLWLPNEKRWFDMDKVVDSELAKAVLQGSSAVQRKVKVQPAFVWSCSKCGSASPPGPWAHLGECACGGRFLRRRKGLEGRSWLEARSKAM